MTIHFYDTSAFLHSDDYKNHNEVYLSNITFAELEAIKESKSKTEQIKYKARKVTKWLSDNDDRLTVILYDRQLPVEFDEKLCLSSDNNDSKIIYCALSCQKINSDKDVVFHTVDISCKNLAEVSGLNAVIDVEPTDNYTGFKEISLRTEGDIAYLYEHLGENNYNLNANEYLIIKNDKDEVIDKMIWTGEELERVNYTSFKTQMFGTLKPKDAYQELAFYSLKNFKTILLRGSAGTGKSLLALNYMFEQLEKNKISKIIIFTNTVATADAAKLGYLPGTKDEKLLDSQIGNFLASKLGGKVYVERLIDDGQLELLPFSDIRGYDTTGMNACIYITEAQNLSASLMQLALQRSDDDSVFIIDGDDNAQVDLHAFEGDNNGIKRLSQTFRGDYDYAEVTLQNIYRSHRAQVAQNMLS